MQPRHVSRWLWLGGALLLLAGPLSHRLARPLGDQLHVPGTPIDRSNWVMAREWAFLQSCRGFVPPRASLTVLAPDPDAETNLYMMALGIFPGNTVLPTSYFGNAVSEGDRAEFVLVYGRRQAFETAHERLGRVEYGAVYRRHAAP